VVLIVGKHAAIRREPASRSRIFERLEAWRVKVGLKISFGYCENPAFGRQECCAGKISLNCALTQNASIPRGFA
jgi:hypothetical protein